MTFTILDIPSPEDREASRRMAGRWKDTVAVDMLLNHIYADRLISMQPAPCSLAMRKECVGWCPTGDTSAAPVEGGDGSPASRGPNSWCWPSMPRRPCVRSTLEIEEQEVIRTQDLHIAISRDGGHIYPELLRQEYTFSPPGTTFEQDLTGF